MAIKHHFRKFISFSFFGFFSIEVLQAQEEEAEKREGREGEEKEKEASSPSPPQRWRWRGVCAEWHRRGGGASAGQCRTTTTLNLTDHYF